MEFAHALQIWNSYGIRAVRRTRTTYVVANTEFLAMSANGFQMAKGNDPRILPLSGARNEFCNATKEELLNIPGISNVLHDCPVCSAYGTRCLVAAHPSAPPAAAAASTTPFQGRSAPRWLTLFWSDCCGGGVIECDGSLTLLNSSWEKFGSNMRKLYIRRCYTAIVESVKTERKTHVLVRGTPGIGKSVFMFYLIYLMAQQDGDVSICLSYLDNVMFSRWYLLKKANGESSVVTDIPMTPDYYFSDSVDIIGPGTANRLTMHFASSDESHFKTFVKVKATLPGSWDIYLPLVELEELEHMVPVGTVYTKESLQFRHDIFGGSARNCLDQGNYSDADEVTRRQIEEALESFFGGINETDKSWAVRMLGENVIKLLRGAYADHLKRSVFQHVYVESATFGETSTSFCSNFMKYLCGKIMQNTSKDITDRIKALFGDCGAGIMFETEAFDLIFNGLKNGGSYTLFNLTKDIEPVTLELKLSNPRKVLIRKIADIACLKENDIGVPVIGNFPLVDFVIKKPPTLLQMTVAATHTGVIARPLVEIQKELGGDESDHKLVFVVPAENCGRFPKCAMLNGIAQFVMCPDNIADLSVLGKRKGVCG